VLKITIDTNNSAFQEAFYNDTDDSYHSPAREVSRILHGLADSLEDGMVETTPLYDYNGNCVGHAIYSPDDE